MNHRWTLHIRDFGKIKSADITAAPITLFVGDNNSGKSYLMAILYSLLNIRLYRQQYDFCVDSSEYAFCSSWIKEAFTFEGKNTKEIHVTNDIHTQLEQLLNKILEKNRQKLVLATFNSDVPIGEINISLPMMDDLFFAATYEEPHDEESAIYTLRPFRRKMPKENYSRARARSIDIKFFLGFILEYLIKSGFKRVAPKDCVFLPTSRTGFLLTYKSLVRASISNTYDSEDSANFTTFLTRPCSDFLKNLSTIEPDNFSEKYSDLIDYIETYMAQGHISFSDNTPQPVIRYRPNSTDNELPLHLTSGVVTELAPLILMLGYHSPIETLFIEEPEMGLHPALQLEMAKVLTKIHAQKTSLFITTHSDIILQHLNNMIKLGTQSNTTKNRLMDMYGYSNEDIVNASDVAMYQFDVDSTSNKTIVSQLSYSDYGFIVPTFNNALKNLLDESRQMEIDIDDGDV